MSRTVEPAKVLDLRTTKCPLNFVKARLALDKLAVGETLEVWLAPDSETLTTLPNSLRQEGHEVEVKNKNSDENYVGILIRRF